MFRPLLCKVLTYTKDFAYASQQNRVRIVLITKIWTVGSMIAPAEGIQEHYDDAPNEASTTDALSADEDGKNCCVSEQIYVESGNEKGIVLPAL